MGSRGSGSRVGTPKAESIASEKSTRDLSSLLALSRALCAFADCCCIMLGFGGGRYVSEDCTCPRCVPFMLGRGS